MLVEFLGNQFFFWISNFPCKVVHKNEREKGDRLALHDDMTCHAQHSNHEKKCICYWIKWHAIYFKGQYDYDFYGNDTSLQGTTSGY